MPWVEFIWFARPLQKILEHGISRGEVEHVLREAPEQAIQQSRSSERMIVRGATQTARQIMVVFEWADAERTTVVPITAFEPESE